MFMFGVMFIKKFKMAHFLYFLLMAAKNQSSFGQNIYVHLNDLVKFFHKMLWIVGFWATFSNISTLEDTKFCYFLILSRFLLIFLPYIFLLTISFIERTQTDLSGALISFSVTNFLLSWARKYKKWTIFDIHFNDHDCRSKHDN